VQYVEGLTARLPVAAAYPRLQQKLHESCGLSALEAGHFGKHNRAKGGQAQEQLSDQQRAEVTIVGWRLNDAGGLITDFPSHDIDSFRYLVPSWLNDKARFVNEAITAKKVAFKLAGAEFAIQASMGIIEI